MKVFKKLSFNPRFLSALLAVLLVLTLGATGYLSFRYNRLKKELQTVTATELDRVKELAQKVGSVYLIPEGEDPVLISIVDSDKLKDQSFFERAKNGDVILVYPKARLAIVYRESESKIVNAGPVSGDISSALSGSTK
jgi:hypothetical protein